MKHVLIIAYLYPPPRASKRLPGLANYLPQYGWEPIVMTAPLCERSNAAFQVVETGYRDALGLCKKLLRIDFRENIRSHLRDRLGITSKRSVLDRLLTFCAAFINYPDSEKGWKEYGIEVGSDVLRRGNIDAMISIYPVTSRVIARELKDRYKIPWIADFPDLWTQNHNYYYGRLRRLIDRRLEIKTIERADALVTTSEPWAEKLRSLHKRDDVFSIALGYDPNEINSPPCPLTDKFTMTYTGSIYQGKQNPSKLFAALQTLIADGAINSGDVEVRFYGPRERWIDEEIDRYGLRGIVNQHGLVPRRVAMMRQRESQVLLLFNWEDPRETGVYTGKVFEYLAGYRPIMSIGGSGRDVVRALLEETKGGMCGSNEAEIMAIVKSLYSQYKTEGKISFEPIYEAIKRYSHKEMAGKFATVLDYVIDRGRIEPFHGGVAVSTTADEPQK